MFYLVCALILYMYLICPSIHKKNLSGFENYFYAHRGLHDNSKNNVENSIDAFKEAIELKYGIELDVRLTKDKVPVVIHDKNLIRVAKMNLNVNEMSFEKLKELKLFNSNQSIPSLSEVLNFVDDKVPLLIEIKKDNINKMKDLHYIAEILDSYKGRYMIESFDPFVLMWLKNNRPHFIRGQLSSNLIKDRGNIILNFLLSNLLFNFLSKPDFIAYDYRYTINLSFIINKYLFKVFCAGFTIQSEEEFIKYKNYFNTIIFDSFIPY